MEIPRIHLIEPVTPYHLAAAIGDLKAFKLMFDSFGNLGWLAYGRTPLHFAAYHGHLDICKFLIEKIKDINPRDIYHETPLHKAASKGHLAICQMILRYTNKKALDVKNVLGQTPLYLAKWNGHSVVAEYLSSLNDK